MAAFVVDASATLPWCFVDEATAATNELLARLRTGDEAIVPAHWILEVGNAILFAVRRQRISQQDGSQFLSDLESLPIRIDAVSRNLAHGRVFLLAAQYGLTLYDAVYLELSIREGLPLATLDDDLRKAAVAAGAPLIWPHP